MIRKAFTIMAAMSIAFVASAAFASGLPKAVSKVPEAQKLIDKAWALEKSAHTPEIYKECVATLEQADKLDANNPDILVNIARYYWSYGDLLPKATPEQQKILLGLYAKGFAAAEKSLKLKETSAAHYWFAVNKAAGLEFSNVMSQAAAFPTIYKHSEYVSDKDPNYYYGATGRLWTEIVARVPKKVVELVGEKYIMELMTQIDNSIKEEPKYLDNYVYKARFLFNYYGAARKDEALKLLDAALKQDPASLPEEVIANKEALKNGRILWKKITGKEYPAR